MKKKENISRNARVLGNALVSGDARVLGGVWPVSPTQIQGSRHFVTHSSPGHITIGCHNHTIQEWKKRYRDIGKNEKYTKEQIEEYGEYIKIIEKADKRMAKLYWNKI